MNKPVSPVVIPVLIIGCGYTGNLLAQKYLEQHTSVTGLVRSPASAERLEKTGIRAITADLSAPLESHVRFQHSQLFHFAPPPSSGVEDIHTRHLLDALRRASRLPRRIVYISTTGVYGDCQGRWIDESEPVKPDADRSRRRLDAEQQLRGFSRQHNVELIILRVAGIYGPGKLPLKRLQQNLPVIRREEAPFTNRIHAHDLVNIAMQAMQSGISGEIYNVSDGHPSTMTEYFNTVADKAGLARPPQISLAEGASRLSAGMMSYMKESRRLKNTKLLEQLQLQLRYPDLETGIEHCGL